MNPKDILLGRTLYIALCESNGREVSWPGYERQEIVFEDTGEGFVLRNSNLISFPPVPDDYDEHGSPKKYNVWGFSIFDGKVGGILFYGPCAFIQGKYVHACGDAFQILSDNVRLYEEDEQEKDEQIEHFGWDYEVTTEPHYQIYPVSPQAEILLGEDSILIFCDGSPFNDVHIKNIVEQLEALASK